MSFCWAGMECASFGLAEQKVVYCVRAAVWVWFVLGACFESFIVAAVRLGSDAGPISLVQVLELKVQLHIYWDRGHGRRKMHFNCAQNVEHALRTETIRDEFEFSHRPGKAAAPNSTSKPSHYNSVDARSADAPLHNPSARLDNRKGRLTHARTQIKREYYSLNQWFLDPGSCLFFSADLLFLFFFCFKFVVSINWLYQKRPIIKIGILFLIVAKITTHAIAISASLWRFYVTKVRDYD